MSILELQRSLRRLGKIRMGDQKPASNGKSRPAKLTTWRITSPTLDLLYAAAEFYGGTPRKWEGAPGEGEQFELYSETDSLDIVLPPGERILDQWYEMWSAGGCQRRCDGKTEVITNSPCACPEDHEERTRQAALIKPTACKITTRLSVILPRVPDIGTWMLESHGYYAAVELAGSLDIVRLAAGNKMVPARLTMQPRTAKRGNETRRYVVPIIELPQLTAAALMGNQPLPIAEPAPKAQLAAARTALGSGSDRSESLTEPSPPRATPPPNVDAETGELDPGRPFTDDDTTLAGLEFARRFAATVKVGNGKDRESNDTLRHALIHHATGGRVNTTKLVLKTEIEAVRAAWKAWTDGRLVWSDTDDGSLVASEEAGQ